MALLLCSACRDLPQSREFSPGEAALGEALAGWRPLEARLRSGLYGETQLAADQRRAARQRRPALARAESLLRGEVQATPTAKLLEALTLTELLWGKAAEAAARLEAALEGEARPASLLNALAVAYLVRADEEQGALDLVRALETISRAAQIEGESSEILFNKALILEQLYLEQEAMGAWKAYLAQDGRSPWAEEARTRLKALQASSVDANRADAAIEEALQAGDAALAEVVRQDPQTAREYAERTLLPAWARARTAWPLQADGLLRSAHRLGRLLFEHNGERIILEEAAAIEKAADDGDKRRLEDLAQGHRLLSQGYELFSDIQTGQAVPLFSQARRLLHGTQSPFEHRAALYLAICHYRQSDFEAARSALQSLQEALPDGFHSLRGRVFWMTGLIQLMDERPVLARDSYLRAMAIYRSLGEQARLAGVYNLLADTSHYLGQSSQAWYYNHLARRAIAGHHRLLRRYVITTEATQMALREGHLRAALHFQNEAVDLAARLGQPIAVAQTLLARAPLYVDLGQTGRALADLEAARSRLPGTPGPEWSSILVQSSLAEAKLLPPDQAVAALQNALTLAQAGNLGYLLPQIYLTRANVHRALGRLEQAEADLLAGIEVCEAQRIRISNREIQTAYFEERRVLFDSMIDFQMEMRKNPLRALEFAERLRARTLLDLALQSNQEPEMAAALFASGGRLDEVPSGVAIIVYTVLQDRLWGWLVRGGEVTSFGRPISRQALEQQVDKFNAAIAQRGPVGQLAKQLFEQLVGPMAARLGTEDALVFIPDKCLYRLPFAALVDPRTDRYLAQDHRIASAPAISLYLLGADRDRQRRREQLDALIVGNPAFDRSLFPELRDLPAAEEEAQRIAALYGPRHLLLTGKQATAGQFRSQAGRRAVVHFGGHAIQDADFPAYSRLVLAPGPSGQEGGSLHAYELSRQRFEETRLVVLAACGTADGLISRGEGPMSLARPFLAAGVPAVLASLWDVEDRSGADFFVHFHRLLGGHADALEALRQTQNRFIASQDRSHPVHWSGFQLLGGIHEVRNAGQGGKDDSE